MAKKIVGFIKLQVPAGKANPSPPIGPALGQRGLNIMEFCKQFNAQTQKMEKGIPTPVIITAFSDKSFTFITKTPPASVLIKKALGLESGSGNPLKEKVGKLTRKRMETIDQEVTDETLKYLDKVGKGDKPSVKVLPIRCRRTQYGAPAKTPAVWLLAPPGSSRRWKARPLPGVTTAIAWRAPVSSDSRIITPALAQSLVFCSEATRAMMRPSRARSSSRRTASRTTTTRSWKAVASSACSSSACCCSTYPVTKTLRP